MGILKIRITLIILTALTPGKPREAVIIQTTRITLTAQIPGKPREKIKSDFTRGVFHKCLIFTLFNEDKLTCC
jgi:hypothetical protein